MKTYNILITAVLLLASQFLSGQAITFEYDYDYAGNRTRRAIIDMTSMAAAMQGDTILHDEEAPPQDMAYAPDEFKDNGFYDDGSGNAGGSSFYNGDRETISDTGNTQQEHLKIKYEGFNIRIFPNPVKEILYMELSGWDGSQDISCQLIDINGRIIENKKVKSLSENFDFSKNPPGIYIMRVLTGSDYKEYKIIKN